MSSDGPPDPGVLFDDPVPPSAPAVVGPTPVGRVVQVLPDVSGLDRVFDYVVPAAMDDEVRLGTLVRIPLHGRRVGGWVVGESAQAPDGVALKALAKVTGWGPPADVVALTSWGAWRWAGRRRALLAAASPDRAIAGPAPRRPGGPPLMASVGVATPATELATAALAAGGVAVVRLPPSCDLFDVVLAAARRGPSVVVAPSQVMAADLGARLRRAGAAAVVVPRGYPAALAGGATVLGARSSAWAPLPDVASFVVLDEHDEVHAEERAPTWHARDVVLERARRAGVPCLLVSPAPSLEALAAGRLWTVSRVAEREGWPRVDVIDRHDDDPMKGGPLSERLVDLVRSEQRVVCVLNRTGRSRLLVCAGCGEIARCERCQAAVTQADSPQLVCVRCATFRPPVCLRCHRTTFRNARAGVTRVREELEALAGRPVLEVAGPADGGDDRAIERARLLVGTEAVLHRAGPADAVVFLDLDQELLAPRYRAAEQALTLLVRGARLVGGRRGSGRLVIQTRQPQHEVIQAALMADPGRASARELERRTGLGYPPVTAMAEVSGSLAGVFVESFGRPPGVEVLGPSDGRWLLRAETHDVLCDALAATPRPATKAAADGSPGRLRIAVDPLRI